MPDVILQINITTSDFENLREQLDLPVEQTEIRASGFKSLGDSWVGWYSNIFPDEEEERFTLKALNEYAQWVTDNPQYLPELQFFHLPNVVLGQSEKVEVIGPFIVATGKWSNTEYGQTAKQSFNTNEDLAYQMSHGFLYHTDDLVAGEYHKFRTYEVTLLPYEWAANKVTLFTGNIQEKNIMTDEKKKGLLEDMVAGLQNLLPNMSKEEAEKVVAEGTKNNTEENAELSLESLAEAVIALAEALPTVTEQVEEVTTNVGKALVELNQKLEGIEGKQAAYETAQKQKLELLPTMLKRTLAGKEVDEKELKADMQEAAKELEATSNDGTALGWFAEQAGLEGV